MRERQSVTEMLYVFADVDSVNSCPNVKVDDVAARKLPESEPEQAARYNPGAVQPADLQSPGLP